MLCSNIQNSGYPLWFKNDKNRSTAKSNWAKIFISVLIKTNVISYHPEKFLGCRNFYHLLAFWQLSGPAEISEYKKKL